MSGVLVLVRGVLRDVEARNVGGDEIGADLEGHAVTSAVSSRVLQANVAAIDFGPLACPPLWAIVTVGGVGNAYPGFGPSGPDFHIGLRRATCWVVAESCALDVGRAWGWVEPSFVDAGAEESGIDGHAAPEVVGHARLKGQGVGNRVLLAVNCKVAVGIGIRVGAAVRVPRVLRWDRRSECCRAVRKGWCSVPFLVAT